MRQLKREQDYAASCKQFDRAKELQAQHDAKDKELLNATGRWRRERSSASADGEAMAMRAVSGDHRNAIELERDAQRGSAEAPAGAK